MQVLDSRPVLDWIAGLPVDEEAFRRPLKEFPQPSKDSDWGEVSAYLFDPGVSSGVIRQLSGEIDELVRIARWYQRTESPSEAETTAYLVVPLLRALGWTSQKMAVGWSGVDLALFSALPRRGENSAAVVVVKAKGCSCLTARSQAQSCAEQPGRGSLSRLIVTNGLRYAVYLKKDGAFRGEARHLPDPREDEGRLPGTRLRRDEGGAPLYGCRMGLRPSSVPG